MPPAQAAAELGAWLKPNAVVCEKSSVGSGDLNAQQLATLEATASRDQEKASATKAHVNIDDREPLAGSIQAGIFWNGFPSRFQVLHGHARPTPLEPKATASPSKRGAANGAE